MFLLACRSSRHETTGVTPAELYFGRDLRLPLDLLRENPPESSEKVPQSSDDFVRNLKERLEGIHSKIRERLNLKSIQVKARYDRGARKVLFEEGQKVWLFKPRREKGRAPKFQSNWEGPFLVIRKLSDVVYCVQKSAKHKKKVMHADRLAPFSEKLLND